MAQVFVSCTAWKDQHVWMAGDPALVETHGRGLVPDDGVVTDRMQTLMDMRARGMLSREQILRRTAMDEDR